MKKFIGMMTAVLLAAILFACGEASDGETTGNTEPPVQTSGTEATSSNAESTPGETSSVQTTSAQETKAAETTSASEETTTDSSVPAGAPVVLVTNGSENVSCYMTEQSPGIAGGFDLTEDYTLLPTLVGESFSLVASADRDDLYYGTYMLYDKNFESQGMYSFNEQHQIIDTASEAGTYYVRITVTVGDPILSTEVYYAWATLVLSE